MSDSAIQHGDQIVRYVKTIRDGIHAFCRTCDTQRPVFVVETQGGATVTCCCSCQRVLRHEPTEAQRSRSSTQAAADDLDLATKGICRLSYEYVTGKPITHA